MRSSGMFSYTVCVWKSHGVRGVINPLSGSCLKRGKRNKLITSPFFIIVIHSPGFTRKAPIVAALSVPSDTTSSSISEVFARVQVQVGHGGQRRPLQVPSITVVPKDKARGRLGLVKKIPLVTLMLIKWTNYLTSYIK